MPNPKESAYKKIEQNLFRSPAEIQDKFSDKEMERKNRIMFCVTKKLEDPLISDKALVDFLTSGCQGLLKEVSSSTAYRDVAAVTRLTGNIQLAAKSWYRYMLIEGAKRGAALAEAIKDPKGFAANLSIIMKTTRADQDDNDIDWEKMIPPSFEPTDDVSILGDNFERIPDLEERRKELRDLFGVTKAKRQIEDAKIISDDSTE